MLIKTAKFECATIRDNNYLKFSSAYVRVQPTRSARNEKTEALDLLPFQLGSNWSTRQQCPFCELRIIVSTSSNLI
jgi:hypothetical protein